MKKWSIWIYNDSILGKIREKILGKNDYLECDELAHGPPGFFEMINTDENSATYVWMKDVKAWRCNFGHKETSEQIRKDTMQEQINQLNNMTTQQQFIAPEINATDTQTTSLKEEAMFG